MYNQNHIILNMCLKFKQVSFEAYIFLSLRMKELFNWPISNASRCIYRISQFK